MWAIAFLRRNRLEVLWASFSAANVVAMLKWPRWETIPFHLIWVSLTLLYGYHVWRARMMSITLGAVALVTGALILEDNFAGSQLWGELFEVPLMSAMFLAMVWHARRRQDALRTAEREAEERASLLQRQERFLHDVSHELRTPVTIARGHLEVLRRTNIEELPEVDVALDELQRIERIVERLLLLAKADNPDFLATDEIELEPFLEDVFMRWSDVQPRLWRLGSLVPGTVVADPESLRIALDALLENAVKYTDEGAVIELGSRCSDGAIVIEVTDEGCGIPPEALERIFDRFARADPARTRAQGGVGLGLAIVDAIAKGHGGRCTVRTSQSETAFSLWLPSFRSRPFEAFSAKPPRDAAAV